MNTLEECKPGMWGSPDTIKNLENAKSARILVIADTHERMPVLRGILQRFGPSCDALIFAGDGAADIVECREEALAEEKMRLLLPPLIVMVMGNGDLPAYKVTSEKNIRKSQLFRIPPMQIIDVCGNNILVTHGHLHSVTFSLEPLVNAARHNNCSIVIYGHTHIPSAERHHSVFALNPGSTCIPRGDSQASFAVLTVSSKPKIEYTFEKPGEGVPAFAKPISSRRR